MHQRRVRVSANRSAFLYDTRLVCQPSSTTATVSISYTPSRAATLPRRALMYPTLNSNNNVGAPFSYPSQQQLGTESRDSRSFASNGPSQIASASSNSNALPVLRVHISEQLCISPPVGDKPSYPQGKLHSLLLPCQ